MNAAYVNDPQGGYEAKIIPGLHDFRPTDATENVTIILKPSGELAVVPSSIVELL